WPAALWRPWNCGSDAGDGRWRRAEQGREDHGVAHPGVSPYADLAPDAPDRRGGRAAARRRDRLRLPGGRHAADADRDRGDRRRAAVDPRPGADRQGRVRLSAGPADAWPRATVKGVAA